MQHGGRQALTPFASTKQTEASDELLGLPEVCALTGRSKSTIYGDLQAGLFPSPVKIGRRTAWPAARVFAYLEKTSPVSTSDEALGTNPANAYERKLAWQIQCAAQGHVRVVLAKHGKRKAYINPVCFSHSPALLSAAAALDKDSDLLASFLDAREALRTVIEATAWDVPSPGFIAVDADSWIYLLRQFTPVLFGMAGSEKRHTSKALVVLASVLRAIADHVENR